MDLLAKLGELSRHPLRDLTLVADDVRLEVARRVAELDCHEALARTVLQILQRALIARVIRDHEKEPVLRLDDLAELLHRQNAPMVRKRMDENGRILSRLDYLVEGADGAGFHRPGERPVNPAGGIALEQVPAHEGRRGGGLL